MSRRIFRITAAFGKIFGIMGSYLKASTKFMKMALRKISRISKFFVWKQAETLVYLLCKKAVQFFVNSQRSYMYRNY
jgi:hypothetical protein